MTNNTVTKNNINFHSLIDVFDRAEKSMIFIIDKLKQFKALNLDNETVEELIILANQRLADFRYHYQLMEDEQNLHRNAPLVFRN